MADESTGLISYIRSRPIAASFEPCAYYGPEEDAVIFYFRNVPDYARRVSRWLTLYLAIDDDQLVGCQVKGVKRVLEDIDAFGIDVEHNKVKLQVLFLAFLGAVADEPDTRGYYRKLGEAATEANTELELPAF